jgi:hypothetical protein
MEHLAPDRDEFDEEEDAETDKHHVKGIHTKIRDNICSLGS